jgi:hypothetical protein
MAGLFIAGHVVLSFIHSGGKMLTNGGYYLAAPPAGIGTTAHRFCIHTDLI